MYGNMPYYAPYNTPGTTYNYNAINDNNFVQTRQTQPAQQLMQNMTPNIPQFIPQQQGNNGLIFVLGEADARSYPVAPGYTVPMWEKDFKRAYIKTMDLSGVPSMRILECSERTISSETEIPVSNLPAVDMNKYVTYEELEKILADFNVPTVPKKPAKSNSKEDINNG